MDEIRLTCESCGVEYRLPGDAIPPGGRQVECTSCGHSWLARPQLKPLSLSPGPAPEATPPGAADDDMPRLSRPLPANVLAILRDELEFENRARAAETPAQPAVASDMTDTDRPATTQHQSPSAPVPQPPAAKPETRPETTEKTQPLASAAVTQPAAAQSPRLYRTGFGLAAMIAAMGLSFYLLAPALGDAGPLGERLLETRHSIDSARIRLHETLFGRD